MSEEHKELLSDSEAPSDSESSSTSGQSLIKINLEDEEIEVQETKPQKKKLRQANTPKEALFLDKAISFLKNIHTGTSEENTEEPSQNVSWDEKSKYRKKSELESPTGNLKLCETESWLSPGGTLKKSYKSCIDSQSPHTVKYSFINLNDYPSYIKNSPIKDQLNSEFRRENPFLDHKLTLSKLVNLREDLIQKVCKECEVEACTLAIAFSCFDTLLKMNLITKNNRKLYAGVCVLLAFKFNEETHLEEAKQKKQQLMRALYEADKYDMLTPHYLHSAEFEVYFYLGFNLHLKLEMFQENFQHILARLRVSSKEYLGKKCINKPNV